MNGLIIFLLNAVAIFLILVVLVQRGRGGGLTGALGGMGGQSAFGAKAGDTFTKITMWTALVWILLCIVSVKYLTYHGDDALAEDKTKATGTLVVPVDGPAKPDAGQKPASKTPPPEPSPPAGKADAPKTAPAAPAGAAK